MPTVFNERSPLLGSGYLSQTGVHFANEFPNCNKSAAMPKAFKACLKLR